LGTNSTSDNSKAQPWNAKQYFSVVGWQILDIQYKRKYYFHHHFSIIIIHLGGNDLTTVCLIKLKQVTESDLADLTDAREAFPQATLIWVDILQRMV
jgi:hypothetical protein